MKNKKVISVWLRSIPFYIVATVTMVCLTFFVNPPRWMKWVLLMGPILWWVFFAVQGLRLFLPKSNIMKRWEDKKIAQYMQQAKQNERL